MRTCAIPEHFGDSLRYRLRYVILIRLSLLIVVVDELRGVLSLEQNVALHSHVVGRKLPVH